MLKEDKIQMAHDTILSILLHEVDVPELQNEGFLQALTVAGGVLCWILEHEHNDSFQVNLNTIIAKLKEAGYLATPMDELVQPLKPTTYPAVEYNNAIRDVELMLVETILQTKDEKWADMLDKVKSMRK